ncbi:hypothetical protein GGI43DRAFT_70191 [Trichoderma evansii]
MAEQLFSALFSSAAVTGNGNGTVTPEQLSEVAALLPLIAFPILSPQRSHIVVFRSSCLNIFSYICNFVFWLSGSSYIHLPYRVVCVTVLSLILGWWAVFDDALYNDWKQDNLSWSGHVICTLISFYFVRLGGYFISFEHLLTWRNIDLLLAWCTTTALAVPRIFATFSTPVSTLFWNFTTRRVPFMFWLDRFAVQPHAEAEAGAYTEVNSQSDSDDDELCDLTGVTAESTENNVENAAGDTTNQGTRRDGEPDTQRCVEQDDEENHQQQPFEQHFEREAEQHHQTGIKRKVEKEKRTPWDIATSVFVLLSVSVLLVLQFIALQ